MQSVAVGVQLCHNQKVCKREKVLWTFRDRKERLCSHKGMREVMIEQKKLSSS